MDTFREMNTPRIYSPDDVASIIQKLDDVWRARIAQGTSDAPKIMERLVLALDTATPESNPYPINFPFRSVVVENASDTSTLVYLKPNSRDSVQAYKSLQLQDSFDIGEGISRAFLHWTAQPGKTITLVFLNQGSFKPGKSVSQNAGGVSISEGANIGAATLLALTAAAVGSIAQNLNRKVLNVYNDTGSTVYFGGDNTTTNLTGIPISPGARETFKNTAAIYFYSVGGGNLRYVEET